MTITAIGTPISSMRSARSMTAGSRSVRNGIAREVLVDLGDRLVLTALNEEGDDLVVQTIELGALGVGARIVVGDLHRTGLSEGSIDEHAAGQLDLRREPLRVDPMRADLRSEERIRSDIEPAAFELVEQPVSLEPNPAGSFHRTR